MNIKSFQGIEFYLWVLNHIKYNIENKKNYKYTIDFQFNELKENWKRIKQFSSLYELENFLKLYSIELVKIYR